MKKIALVFAVGALLVALGNYALQAQAAPAFEDPQLCVGGELMRVDPTTAPIEVWVQVGDDVQVDSNVANCGGNSSEPIVDASHISNTGKKNTLEVTVLTDPNARVILNFDGDAKNHKANESGWAVFKTKVK